MKKIVLRYIIVPLLSSVLLTNVLPNLSSNVAMMSTAVPTSKTEVMSFAKQWQEQLAEQSNFTQWKGASLKITPLGPGTHSWLALIEKSNEVIGYMIIHALEEGGYSLGEYGIGDATSLQLLSEHVDSFTYMGPFHSLITLTNAETSAAAYVEPFLQEQFPIEASIISEVEKHYIEQNQIGHGAFSQPALVTGSDSIEYFAPYDVMPWLTTEPLNYSFEDDTSIEVMIELGSELRYTTESWNHEVFSVYSITGYHEWNEFDLFIALQADNDELTRYISYDTLMVQGLFYDRASY